MNARNSIRRRGQPLLALILVMVSWVGARAAMWEAPRVVDAVAAQQAPARPGGVKADLPIRPTAPRVVAPPPRGEPAAPSANEAATPAVTAPDIVPAPTETAADIPSSSSSQDAVGQPSKGLSLEDAADHQELFSAGMNLPTVEQGAAMDAPRRPRGVPNAALIVPTGSPWSADAWLLLRGGSNGFNAPGAGLPGVVVPAGFYGGSQAGAVLRYRLSLLSALAPTLYLRASSGLEYPRGEEVAAGLSFRPVPKAPIAVMAEGRVTRTTSGTIVRPAAAVVTLLPPARLPLGLRGEAYVQAGYVGGRDATAFVDGQARVEKPLLRSGRTELRAGGGLWGGAQRGANRVDVGPTATLSVPIGPAGARVSADYRIRVAGRAAPGSGVVLTLSAGF